MQFYALYFMTNDKEFIISHTSCNVSMLYESNGQLSITYSGQDKTIIILPTAFANPFSWMMITSLQFHWSLFSWVQSVNNVIIDLGNALVPNRQQVFSGTNDDEWLIKVSLGFGELLYFPHCAAYMWKGSASIQVMAWRRATYCQLNPKVQTSMK